MNRTSQILIADDEPPIRRFLERFLAAQGHVTESVESGEAAIEAAVSRRPDLVLLDVMMPGGLGGLETLERMSRELPGVPVVIMTATGTIETAVRAFKLGAVDFVQKPFDEAKLRSAVDAAVGTRSTPAAVRGPTMIGESMRFREAMDLAQRFARPEITILLHGETGTGKELFARYIHESSKRKDGPFIPVDCSILSEQLIESELFGHEKGAFTGAMSQHKGHFERAHQGTLFLDEIGNLRLDVQAKLLRVLQMRTIERVGGKEQIPLDIRVVAATNANLKEAVEQHKFRQDLYFRLCEAVIVTPPLRERAGDVRRLARHFLDQYAARWELPVKDISPEAIAELESRSWPGNVRQLENVMKSAVILADKEIRPKHLADAGASPDEAPQARRALYADTSPFTLPSASSRDEAASPGRQRIRVEVDVDPKAETLDLKALTTEASDKAERALLLLVISQNAYTMTQLARVLRVDPKTLREKLRYHGIDPKTLRDKPS